MMEAPSVRFTTKPSSSSSLPSSSASSSPFASLPFQKVAVDGTGTLIAVCLSGQPKVQIYRMTIDDDDGDDDCDNEDASSSSSSSEDDENDRRSRRGELPTTFQFICESVDLLSSVMDVCWSHSSAGLLLAISCLDKCIHVLRLGRTIDGRPLLDVNNSTLRAFSIFLKDVALCIAFPAVARPTPLLATGSHMGLLTISSILSRGEKRESTLSLGEAVFSPEEEFHNQRAERLATHAPNGLVTPDACKPYAITALAWSPSVAESNNVLAIGFSNGTLVIARVELSNYTVLLRVDYCGTALMLRDVPQTGLNAATRHLSASSTTKNMIAGSAQSSAFAASAASPCPLLPYPQSPYQAPITSVAWAPPLGKRTNTIAICSGGGGVGGNAAGGKVTLLTVVPTMGVKDKVQQSAYTLASIALQHVVVIGGKEKEEDEGHSEGLSPSSTVEHTNSDSHTVTMTRVVSVAIEGVGKCAFSRDGERLAVTCSGGKVVALGKQKIGDGSSWRVL